MSYAIYILVVEDTEKQDIALGESGASEVIRVEGFIEDEAFAIDMARTLAENPL